jgi:hypothetical protein
MIMFASLLVGTGFVINVADTVPRYDVTSICRAAIELAGNTGRTVDSCVAGEEAARKDLAKDWSKIPSAERTQCMGTVAVGGSPSYVELLICVEMLGDSRKRREDERAPSKANPTSKPR